jgi:6-phosphogluconolactonase
MPDAAASTPALRVLATADAVAEAAAGVVARVLGEAVLARGVAHWATTGGSSAPPMYRRLGGRPLRDTVDWEHVHVWWGDDRFVPPDDPLSNVLPLTRALVATGAEAIDGDGLPIPPANLHPVPVSAAIARSAGPAWAADAYAVELRAVGPAAGPDGVPAFDLVVVGIGPDGHLLSVFPASAVWDDEALCSAVPAPSHVEPHVPRVTMHPRVLAAARTVLVVTSGASKAAALEAAWTGEDVRALPVRAARAANAIWLLDEAAAAGLPHA